ncbi:MAG: hypothetical protein ACE5FW_01805 [Candidatus Aenigmatarchaeota archaeon]
MLLFVLGLVDAIVGVLLLFSSWNPLVGSGLVIALGVLWFFKGIYSILAGASSGFYLDFLGIFDLLAGVFLVLSYLGLSWGFLIYLAALMIIKGVYSFGVDFFTTFIRG